MRTYGVPAGLVVAAVVAVIPNSAVARGDAALRIRCEMFHRPAVTMAVRRGPRFELSDSHPAVTGPAGAFGFRATIGDEPGSKHEAISVRIWGRRSGKPVASTLHQFGPAGPSNQFGGGHGFTGLVYAYLPSGAELQYYCRRA